MGYDDVIPHLGKFGKYQQKLYFLLCLPAISCAFHKLAGVFLLAKPDHRCRLPSDADNATFELPAFIRNASYPIDSLTKTWSMCEYFNVSDSLDNGTAVAASCDRWVYDDSRFESSIVTEWGECSANWPFHI
jgi:MFS transporter, OCT family, solute carrier family 22 (organic cation transporter), member 4/5